VDLAGLPKDSFYLYRSHWNTSEFSFDAVVARKLRVNITRLNFKSIYAGIIELEAMKVAAREQNPYFNVVDIYRLRWMDVPYAPGEIKAVAYQKGQMIGEAIVRTAEKAAELRLTPDRGQMHADGMDLCYVTVEMVDQIGQICPLAMDNLAFKVSGAARLAGVANGDQMGFDSFTDARHPLFFCADIDL
jgi:beta-galactosidase